jgi:copper transport protein
MDLGDTLRSIALPLVRLGGYMATSLLFGIPMFALLVLRPNFRDLEGPGWDEGRRRIASRLEGLVRASLIAAALTTALYFLLQATVIAEFTGEEIDPDSIGSILKTSFGRWYALRFPLLAALAVVLIGRVRLWVMASASGDEHEGPKAWWIVWLFLGFGLFVTTTFAGHAAVSSPRSLALANDLLHQVFVSTWFAGIVGLAVVLPEGWSAAPDRGLSLLAPAVSRFAKVAIWSIGLAALTGTFQSLFNLASPSDLIDSSYGRTLALKILLFFGILALGGVNHYLVQKRLARALSDGVEGGAAHLFRRTIAAELAIAIGLMAATGLLVGLARTRPSSAPMIREEPVSLSGRL